MQGADEDPAGMVSSHTDVTYVDGPKHGRDGAVPVRPFAGPPLEEPPDLDATGDGSGRYVLTLDYFGRPLKTHDGRFLYRWRPFAPSHYRSTHAGTDVSEA